MTKPELGIKRFCGGCSAKFYDLHKSPIVCPTCQTVFVPHKPPPERTRRVFDTRSMTPRDAAPVALVEPKENAEEADAEGSEEVDTGIPLLEEIDDDDDAEEAVRPVAE